MIDGSMINRLYIASQVTYPVTQLREYRTLGGVTCRGAEKDFFFLLRPSALRGIDRKGARCKVVESGQPARGHRPCLLAIQSGIPTPPHASHVLWHKSRNDTQCLAKISSCDNFLILLEFNVSYACQESVHPAPAIQPNIPVKPTKKKQKNYVMKG